MCEAPPFLDIGGIGGDHERRRFRDFVAAIELPLRCEVDPRRHEQRHEGDAGHDESRPLQEFFHEQLHKMLTIRLRKTQHLVVHRFARERDEKGMR